VQEKDILLRFPSALEKGDITVYFQPQFNHSNGLLIGAEALCRWMDGDRVISPAAFIPVLEANALTAALDLFVFRQACLFQKAALEKRQTTVPISVNLSRTDLRDPSFAEKLEEIRRETGVPAGYLPLELTESSVMEDMDTVKKFIADVHGYGYKIEMDDFGSGYSSLNVLKEIDFDIIKLDLRFLQGTLDGGKAGIIISSITRMAYWLGLPVIAEGVETVQQADFMLSLGCDYIQGFLYSRPIPWEEFENMLSGAQMCRIVPHMSMIDTLDAGAFWTPESLETLIFSNYTGGACIFEYRDGKTEILRVNEKFLSELGMNLSEKELVHSDILALIKESDRAGYVQMLSRAAETNDEAENESWLEIKSRCCGTEKLCIRSSVRLIGKSDNCLLFYANIRNITAEKQRFNDILDSERRFKMASEQVNIYYWEYTVATKEMRPCFRCMRDLGLPALVTNYPEPAIEAGIFPPEVADMYRDWHKQIEAGAEHLEAVIPLTVGRVPFLVRYTTEFDENHRPVKAYGSAALVIDAK